MRGDHSRGSGIHKPLQDDELLDAGQVKTYSQFVGA